MTGNQLVGYLKKSFFTGAFKTIIVTLSTIVFLPLIIKQVGIETYGLISLTMIFGGMVVFADFGIAKSVTLLIGQDKDNNVNTIVSNALMINISILILIGLVLMTLVMLDVPIFGNKLQQTSTLKNYIVLVGFISLSIMLINNLLTAILESFYLMHYVNIGFMFSSIFINVFIYIVSISTDSLYLLLMAPTISFLFVSFFFLHVIRIHTKVKLVKPDRKQIKNILSISYKFFNIGMINALILPANKYLLIYITGSSSALGIFDIAVKIALIASSLLNTIAQPLFGVFSNNDIKKEEIYVISKKVSIIIFGAYLVGISIYYIIGVDISHFIDSNNYQSLYELSFILIIGLGMNAVSEPFYRALLGMSRLKEAFRLKLLVPFMNITFFLLLGYQNNLTKITLSYSLAMFFGALIILFYFIYNYNKSRKI
jgi:O-antigen/teichoic acid export membrane protein